VVEPDEIEREPHAERVHRPAAWDLQRDARLPVSSPDEAAHASEAARDDDGGLPRGGDRFHARMRAGAGFLAPDPNWSRIGLDQSPRL
jgi:hypothetical protein